MRANQEFMTRLGALEAHVNREQSCGDNHMSGGMPRGDHDLLEMDVVNVENIGDVWVTD